MTRDRSGSEPSCSPPDGVELLNQKKIWGFFFFPLSRARRNCGKPGAQRRAAVPASVHRMRLGPLFDDLPGQLEQNCTPRNVDLQQEEERPATRASRAFAPGWSHAARDVTSARRALSLRNRDGAHHRFDLRSLGRYWLRRRSTRAGTGQLGRAPGLLLEFPSVLDAHQVDAPSRRPPARRPVARLGLTFTCCADLCRRRRRAFTCRPSSPTVHARSTRVGSVPTRRRRARTPACSPSFCLCRTCASCRGSRCARAPVIGATLLREGAGDIRELSPRSKSASRLCLVVHVARMDESRKLVSTATAPNRARRIAWKLTRANHREHSPGSTRSVARPHLRA